MAALRDEKESSDWSRNSGRKNRKDIEPEDVRLKSEPRSLLRLKLDQVSWFSPFVTLKHLISLSRLVLVY